MLDASFVYQKEGGKIGKVPSSPSEALSSSLVTYMQKIRLRSFLKEVHGLDETKIKINVPYTIDFAEGKIGMKLKPLMKNKKGMCVQGVNGQAASKKVNPGDFITHVEGQCVVGLDHNEALKILTGAKRPVSITFMKPPPAGGWNLVENSTADLYKYWSLSEQTQDFVSHAMGLYGDDEHMAQPAYMTMAALRLYAKSVMRYQKSPFLFPKYGLGEMPQGFSRLCALQGGVQSLRVGIEEIAIDAATNKVAGLVLKYEDKVHAVSTTRMITSPEYLSDSAPSNATAAGGAPKFAGKMRRASQVVRSICILDHPMACGSSHKAETLQVILPQKQTGRKNDIYIACMSEKFKVAPKNFFIAIVSTTVETATPLKEVEMGIKLLGNIVARFDKVSDVMVPVSGDDGTSDNLFATSSFDATSHFESIVQDVQKVYKRITGESLDLSEKSK